MQLFRIDEKTVEIKKKQVEIFNPVHIADDWTRTSTLLLGVDFESTASTIPPHRHEWEIIKEKGFNVS